MLLSLDKLPCEPKSYIKIQAMIYSATALYCILMALSMDGNQMAKYL